MKPQKSRTLLIVASCSLGSKESRLIPGDRKAEPSRLPKDKTVISTSGCPKAHFNLVDQERREDKRRHLIEQCSGLKSIELVASNHNPLLLQAEAHSHLPQSSAR